jgi:predicted secreted Zn-dependent protease
VLPFSKPKFIVSNIFYPNQSRVKKSEQHRYELLEHEQLHFDISEVYARRLRKEFALSRLNYFNLKKQSEKIFNVVYKTYIQRQKDYENETDFSLNKQMQIVWKNTIKEELTFLKEFAK